MKIAQLVLSALALSASVALAEESKPYFRSAYRSKEAHCASWGVERFSRGIDYGLFVGAQGAVGHGFTYEIPLSRAEGDVLWCALNPEVAGHNHVDCKDVAGAPAGRPFAAFEGKPAVSPDRFPNMEKELETHLAWIKEEAELRGGDDFGRMGTSLEFLVPHYLQIERGLYPDAEYAVEGGVEYRESAQGRTLGELDILVYRRKDCAVAAVGEVKFSGPAGMERALKKAKEQIQRFKAFLDPYLKSKLDVRLPERVQYIFGEGGERGIAGAHH
ncbi:MAG: hypothetical protein HY921_12660 [Elusimicrobia bacterium]|nr:hypothetical protein [Elusimicrobiota bacterium]